MPWLAMIWLFKPYISQWKSDFDGLKNKDGQLSVCYLTNTSYLATSLPEIPGLVPWESWPYLSHFKSNFDCVKSKVGLNDSYNLSSYLASQSEKASKHARKQVSSYICKFWLLILSGEYLLVAVEVSGRIYVNQLNATKLKSSKN